MIFATGESGNIYVVGADGTAIVGSGADAGPVADGQLESATMQLLFANEGNPITYSARDGNEVTGTLTLLPPLAWAVGARIPVAEPYARH